MARHKQAIRASSSVLMDANARQRLQVAAEAAGMSLEQLVDLVHDSGALALPPEEPDGITTQVTLKDLGQRMWGEMQVIGREDRTDWFRQLLEPQQIALVVNLCDQGFRPEVVARDLNIPATEVRRWLDAYADRIGAMVTQVRLTTIAGRVQLAAERAMEGLLEKKDFKGYFSIQKDVVGILQSLGIVDQAIHRVEVTHKIGDDAKAEIEAMLELERKQQRRLAEIRDADFELVDAVPQLDFEKEA